MEKSLLMRADACILDAARGSARPGEWIQPAKCRDWGEHGSLAPGSASGYFNLSSASLQLPGQNCLFFVHLSPTCSQCFWEMHP